MLTGVHVLLTYRCTYECDHCFLHCGPDSQGTFTVARLRELLDQAVDVGTVEWIWFEGGEPFLLHPVLLEGVRAARERGFRAGIVTNAYWAETSEDAELWLRPLADVGLDSLILSDDAFHYLGDGESPASLARQAADRLGLTTGEIRIPHPEESDGVVFRGRAADKLTEGLPRLPPDSFGAACPEPLDAPDRVHVDSFGHVHACQGISIGNVWKRPLAEIIKAPVAHAHPIVGPILAGGPAALAAKEGFTPDERGYVSICHFCYTLRVALQDRYPGQLTPRQVYGRPSGPAEAPGSP